MTDYEKKVIETLERIEIHIIEHRDVLRSGFTQLINVFVVITLIVFAILGRFYQWW